LCESAERLQQAHALISLSQSTSILLGPVASGLLVVVLGPGWIFAVDGVTFLVSAAALLATRLPRLPRTAGGSFVAELRLGFREVVRRDWLLPSLLTFSFVNLSFAGFLVIGPMAM